MRKRVRDLEADLKKVEEKRHQTNKKMYKKTCEQADEIVALKIAATKDWRTISDLRAENHALREQLNQTPLDKLIDFMADKIADESKR